MTDRVARSIVVLAALLVPDDHHGWGEAMRAEVEEAMDDHRALAFALGCVGAALAALGARAAGRFAIARWAASSTLIVPLAGLHLGYAWSCWRFVATGQDPYYAALMAGDEAHRRIAAGYVAAAPVFGGLLVMLGVAHLCAARHIAGWHVAALRRAVAVALLAAAGLAVTIAIVLPSLRGMAFQFTGVAAELVLLALFHAWSARVRAGASYR